MIISHKVLRNVSLTAHPQGCAQYVRDQIFWVRNQSKTMEITSLYKPADTAKFPKRVLVLGGSTGYGLSSRIVSAFAGGATTINVSFEREPTETKTATPGWYNTKVFEQEAIKAGIPAASIFADAFATDTKEATGDLIKRMMGQVDLVIYSLASPVRTDPATGEVYRSVIKPIGKPYTALSVDISSGIIETATIEAAEENQIGDTVKVMGGEDWMLWIFYLLDHNLLAPGAKTVSYSYIGPEITYPVYREGTIGKAKEDLERTAAKLRKTLSPIGGEAFISVNKALVTRASSVIPVVPLYMAILYRVMKARGLHERCTEQMYRLFTERLYADTVPVDDAGRIRLDDWEMKDEIQKEVDRIWHLQKEGLPLIEGDLDGFRQEYDQIHGFGFDSIDYTLDVDPRLI